MHVVRRPRKLCLPASLAGALASEKGSFLRLISGGTAAGMENKPEDSARSGKRSAVQWLDGPVAWDTEQTIS